MMARLGAMPKFITPVEILHGRCGEQTGCRSNRAITDSPCVRLTVNATCLSASRATFATFGRGLVKKQGRPTSGSADTTRSCDRRLLRGPKACGDAGKRHLVSTFYESTNFLADQKNLFRECPTIS